MKYHLLKTKLLSTDMEKYHVCHSLDDMVDRCSIYKPSTLTVCLFRLWQLNYLKLLNTIIFVD